MIAEEPDTNVEPEKTQPPLSALRYETPSALYSAMPQVSQLTQHRPQEGENGLEFLLRLRASTTPEEAVTFTAFAALPKMAIWWGYECLRLAGDDLSAADRAMMELVANWTTYPDDENRYRAAKAALYAPVRSPAMFLGLASTSAAACTSRLRCPSLSSSRLSRPPYAIPSSSTLTLPNSAVPNSSTLGSRHSTPTFRVMADCLGP